MFAGDEEDGDFLSPSSGAKLASLFGLDQEASGGDQSFQYTAPKQPRRTPPAPANQKAAAPPGAPAVLLAAAVQAFRFVNGQYAKQGKLGAAVLGSHAAREYQLLLYLSQQKPVTAARIHAGFLLTVQPNNFCSFYDDHTHNWSLRFDSDQSASDFCREVCLAKANSAPVLDSVVVQDLSLGQGPALEQGDSVEVVYTGWLLQNQALGQMFDSNQDKDKLLRLKIGAGKVIRGWEDGLRGMRKGGRRFLVVPPGLAYGAAGVPGRVPPNSTLLFQAHIRRVKFSKDPDGTGAGSRDSAAPSPAPSLENLAPENPAPPTEAPAPPTEAPAPPTGPGRPGDPALRSKSNSLSEQFSNPDSTKARLISRMARMGQPLLPFLSGGAGQPESSDSELEDTSSSQVKDGPEAPPPAQVSAAAPASSLMPLMTSAPPLPHQAFQPYSYPAPAPLQPLGPLYPAHSGPYLGPGPGELASLLVTEARQHGTEVRLAVGKVSDRLDQLVAKVDDLQRQGGLSMGVPSVSMETSMVLHSVQRMVQENESLKKEVFEKSSRIEEQNRKIGELLNENQRYLEQSHLLLEQRTDSLKSCSQQNQALLLQAQQDQVRLSEDLACSASRLSELQLQASAHQHRALELQARLDSALQDGEQRGRHTAALEAQLEELTAAAERRQNLQRSEKQRRKEAELRVSSLEEELQDLRTDKEVLERGLADRKEKWQAERRRRDEEVEGLRAELRRTRTAVLEGDRGTRAQLEEDRGTRAQLEGEHRQQVEQLERQRDALQEQLERRQEEVQVLEQQAAALREQLDRGAESGDRGAESGDTAAEVKRVMNGVFQALRGQFDLGESYGGREVLALVVRTIKEVTLQLLAPPSGEENPHLNGGTGPEEDRHRTRSQQEEVKTQTQTRTQTQTEAPESGGLHPASADLKVPESEAHPVGVQEEAQQVQEVQEEVQKVQEEVPKVQEVQDKVQQVQQVQEEAQQVQDKVQEVQDKVQQVQDEVQQVQDEVQQVQDEVQQVQDEVQKVQQEVLENIQEEVQQEVQQEVQGKVQEEGQHEVQQEVQQGGKREVQQEVRAPRPQTQVGHGLGPPANPPPPPSPAQPSRAAGGDGGGGPAPGPEEEEEEEEMGLKGRPPPAPLFAEDEDEDDLDWLN